MKPSHLIKCFTPLMAISVMVSGASAQQPAGDTLQGVVTATDKAEIASGISARVIKLPRRKGQSFNKGDLLVSFDCDARRAEAEALQFGFVALQRKYENARELALNGAAGTLDSEIAKAEMQQARAEAKALRTRLKECEVKAPYDGVVVERHVAEYETPSLNAPLLTIINADDLEIQFIAPSRMLQSFKTGDRFTFLVDDTGTRHEAKIIRTGAMIDPVSQTIELIAAFADDQPRPLAGMSGTARFDATLPDKTTGR